MAKLPEISMALADEKLDTIESTGANTLSVLLEYSIFHQILSDDPSSR